MTEQRYRCAGGCAGITPGANAATPTAADYAAAANSRGGVVISKLPRVSHPPPPPDSDASASASFPARLGVPDEPTLAWGCVAQGVPGVEPSASSSSRGRELRLGTAAPTMPAWAVTSKQARVHVNKRACTHTQAAHGVDTGSGTWSWFHSRRCRLPGSSKSVPKRFLLRGGLSRPDSGRRAAVPPLCRAPRPAPPPPTVGPRRVACSASHRGLRSLSDAT